MDRRNYAIILILLLAASPAIYSAYYTWAVPAPSIGATVEPGSLSKSCSYVVYEDGSTILASKGDGTGNKYSGTSAASIITSALNDLTAGRTAKEKVCLRGTFDITSTIQIPSYTIIEIEGSLRATANVDMLSGVVGGNTQQVEIRGGTIDVNLQSAGSGIIFQGTDAGGGVQNILIENIRFLNPGARAIQINYVLGASLPTGRNRNVIIQNIYVDGTGFVGTGEAVIMVNTQGGKIDGYFTNIPNNPAWPVAIWGYNRDILITGTFIDNPGRDIQIVQSERIMVRTIHGGNPGNNVYISDARDIDVEIMATAIDSGINVWIVDGTGTSFDGHPNLQTGSAEITVHDSRLFNADTGIVLDTSNRSNQTRIYILNNYFENVFRGFRVGGGPNPSGTLVVRGNQGTTSDLLAENWGSTTISASTSVTVTHNLFSSPTTVIVTSRTTSYGTIFVGVRSSTVFSINVTISGTYTIDWYGAI